MTIPNTSKESADEIVLAAIAAMKQQEDYYKVDDYLHQQWPPQNTTKVHTPQHADVLSSAIPVDQESRQKMCEWSKLVASACKFNKETVVFSMSILDRLLCSSFGEEILADCEKFQLAAMTAFYCAVKVHEPQAVKPSFIAALSRGVYDASQVEEMELKMLQAIKWRVNPPTPNSFIRMFMELLPRSIDESIKKNIIDLVETQVHHVISDYNFVTVEASSIAFAFMMNAFQSLEVEIDKRFLYQNIVSNAILIHCDSIMMHELRICLDKALPTRTIPDHEMSTTQSTTSHGLSKKHPKRYFDLSTTLAKLTWLALIVRFLHCNLFNEKLLYSSVSLPSNMEVSLDLWTFAS